MPFKFTYLNEINKTESWFPWDEVLSGQISNPKTIKYGLIFTPHPALIPKLRRILETTPKRIQANYMMLRFIELNLDDISWRYLKLMVNRFDNVQSGSEFWCPRLAFDHFLVPIVSQYLKQYSDTLYRDDIINSDIIRNIKDQYLNEMMKVRST